MDKITISVPEPMGAYVKDRVASGQFGNISEFFRDLVRKDQEKQQHAVRELRDLMDRAEASGVSDRSFQDIMKDAKAQAKARGLLDDKL